MECEESVKDVVDRITLRISMSESPPQTLNTTPKSSLKDNCSYRNTFTKTPKSEIDKPQLVDNDHIVLSEELLDGLDCNTSRKDNFLDEPNSPSVRCEVPSNLTESSQSSVPREVFDSYAKITKHVKHHSLDRNHERPKKYKHCKRYNSLGNCIIDNARLARASNDCERANGVNKICKPIPSISTLYGTWPVDRSSCDHEATSISSIMSFYSAAHSNHSFFTPNHYMTSSQQLGSKVECVYSLLSMLGSNNSVEMSNKFLNMTKNVDSCIAMRQSGCIPLLVQLVHTDPDYDTRKKAAMALQNVVQSNPNDRARKREAKVWRLLIQVREHSDKLLAGQEYESSTNIAQAEQEHPEYEDIDRHPTAVMATLMKISFDEEHRRAMCDLGAIYSLAHLIYVDHLVHGSITEDDFCITLRRYTGMALTNLTFGDSNNKALLCSFKHFMKALVAQLQSSNDDLMQVSASVIRNMSWQADATCKQILREVGAVAGLTQAAINGKKESTLKAILSALWNLSAHCTLNKVDICSVDGALGFLVQMSNYKAPSKTLAIIENAGGILRNISSHVAVREDYRQILRDHNFLMILLQQLKSPSLTIVSNACGTLWNLSSRCRHDQQFLWDNGAVPMLSSLIHSKHRMISMGSSAALKNLLNKLGGNKNIMAIDSGRKGLGLPCLPMLGVRKHKAQQQHQHPNITDTYENIEPFIPLSEEEKNSAVFLQHSFHRSNIIQSLDHKKPSKFDEFQTQCAEILNRQCEQEVRSRSHESITNTYSNYEHKPFSRFNRTLKTVSSNSNEAFTTHDTPESVSYTLGSNTNRISISDCELSKSTTNPQFMKNCSKISKVGFKIEPESNNMSSSTFRVGKVFDFSFKFGAGSKEQQMDLKKTNSDSKTHLTSVNAEVMLCNSHSSVVDRVDSLSSPSLIPFGDYQETDLDQPTNYSLRYAENDVESTSDSDEQNQSKEAPFTHDSVKCYYTEGTPYHTPHMFSTATSLSDLRVISIDDAKSSPKVKLSVKQFIKESSNKKRSDQMCSSDEKDNCSDDNDLAVETPKGSQDFDFKFSSGLASPEKPINYCDEGTPGYFSRVSSLSSFGDVIEDKNTINANVSKSPKEDTVKSYTEKETIQDMAQSEAIHKDVSGKCIEVVRVLDYAEETPLMFSRCSSLSSLSSIDQPDGPYDHSSVISDFSRLTSGVVSPSELPDSPTQVVPTSSGCIESSDQQMYTPVRLVQENVPLRSVFEDQLASFLEESTPVHFSSVSSLSDLILECENKDENNFLDGKVKPHDEKPIEVAKVESRFDSECEEEDDDILAVCINIGMQNRQKVNGVSTVIDYSNPKRASTGFTNLHCTEDTPIASKFNSDVSILSIRNSISYDIKHTSVNNSKNVCDGNEELSDSSDSSSDTENVLAECIKSGLPKGLSLHSEHNIPNVNKDKHDLSKYLENEITGRSIATLELTEPIPNLPLFSLGRDEVSKFDMEGSPCNFSVISGLSDLTVNSVDYTSQANLKKLSWPVKSSKGSESTTSDFGIMAQFQHCNSSPEEEMDLTNAGSSSSVSVKSNADDSTVLSLAISAGFPKNIYQDDRILNTGKRYKSTEYDREQKHHMVSYRQESALNKLSSSSSSSLDSVEACDGEQLLFKQCIESGMPRQKPKQKLMDVVSSKKEISHKDKRLFKAMTEHMTPERYYRSRNEQRVSDHNLDQSIRETKPTRRISEQPNKRTPNIDIDKKQGGKQRSSHISRLSINNDTNSNFCSSEHESVLKDKALLAECIYSGMPKRKSYQESQNKKPCKLNSVKKSTHLNKNHHDSSSQTCDYDKYLQNQNQSQNIIQTVNPKNVLDTSAVVPGLLLACDAHFTDPAVGVETMIQFKSNGENIEDMQSTFRTCSQHSSENDNIHEANRFIVTANVVQSTLDTCSLMMKNGSEINVEHKYKTVVEVNNDHGDSMKSSRIIDDVQKFGNVQDNDRIVLSVTNNTSEPISYSRDTEISVVNYVNSTDPGSVSPNVDEVAEFGYPAKYSRDKELQISYSNASESIRSFNANSSKSFLCNAWNEDSNSCDLSLPSISGSVPKLVFKANPSGHIEINESMVFNDKKLDFEMTVETSNNDINNILCDNVEFNENPSLVTRLCEISNSISSSVKVSYMKKKNQNDMIDGVNSINLDIGTSPQIGNNATSLTNNATGESNIRMEKVIFQNSNRIDIKSLSSGLMVHKAIGNFMRSESIENAGNSCSNSSSCIQHYIKPPSAMEYILDMENSMTSVSSITSEIADCIQSESCQHPTFELCQSMIDSYENGNKSIEKIDPPSFIDFQLDKTVSTHDKKKFDCGKISTQKRNRQLCKDRYKTYVIGSELPKTTEPVTQNNSVAQTVLHSVGQSNKILSSHRENDTEQFLTHTLGQPDYVSSFHLDTKSDKRKTVKQRRLEDRDRFRTRIIGSEIQEERHNTRLTPNHTEFFKMQEDLQDIITQDANLVLEILNENDIKDDFIDLDCETLSLVSNDDDLECSSLHLIVKKINCEKSTRDSSLNGSATTINDAKSPYFYTSKSIVQSPIESDVNNKVIVDFTSLEYDQYSDTESCHQNISDNEEHPLKSPDHTKHEVFEKSAEEKFVKKPVKGVRGQCITAYVSPYRRGNSELHSKHNIVKPAINDTQKPVVKSSKSSMITKTSSNITFLKPVLQKTNITTQTNRLNGKTSAKARGNKCLEVQQKVIERQGTFVKENTSPSLLKITRIPMIGERKKFNNVSGSSTPSTQVKSVTQLSMLKKPSTHWHTKLVIKRPTGAEESTPSYNCQRKTLQLLRTKQLASRSTNFSSTIPVINSYTDKLKTVKKTSPAHDVSSKIASLWRKVEKNEKHIAFNTKNETRSKNSACLASQATLSK